MGYGAGAGNRARWFASSVEEEHLEAKTKLLDLIRQVCRERGYALL